MTLSDFASIGSLVSGIAVLISLVYLSLQVRQAERNQQSAIRDSRTTRIVDIYMRCTETSLADAIAKCGRGDADVSDTQIVQFTLYILARLASLEESFSQFKAGLLSEDAMISLTRGLRAQFSSPGSRALYVRLRATLSDEFAAFADEVIASTPVTLALTAFAISNFRSNVAAELAKVRA